MSSNVLPLAFGNYPAALLYIIDALAVTALGYTAYEFRFFGVVYNPNYEVLIYLGATLYFLACFTFREVWRPPLISNIYSTVKNISLSLTLAFLILFAFMIGTKTAEEYSRLWLVYWFFSSFTGLLILRVGIAILVRILFSERVAKNVLLLNRNGTSYEPTLDPKVLLLHGFRIDPVENVDSKLGSEFLEKLVNEKDIMEVWIWSKIGSIKDEKFFSKVEFDLRHTAADIKKVYKTSDIEHYTANRADFGSLTTVDVSCSPHSGIQRVLKNLEDYVGAFSLLIVVAPFCLVIAVMIKMTSKGPVLFKQHRHGNDGRPFRVYKFRTMYSTSSSDREVKQATISDPRITPIGRILRKSSLDELPQLYNVLQGRMSLVGPRPHALSHNHYYKDLIDLYMKRHLVKPGMTGLAQINGFRGETKEIALMEKRVSLDLEYIEKWTIWLDIKILLLTPIAIIKSTNAR